MRRNDTGRRHAASVEVKIVSEVHLRTNDFGRRHNHASCTALHAYNMYMAEIHGLLYGACLYVRVRVHVCLCVHVRVCVCIPVLLCVHVCLHLCVHMCAHARV